MSAIDIGGTTIATSIGSIIATGMTGMTAGGKQLSNAGCMELADSFVAHGMTLGCSGYFAGRNVLQFTGQLT